MKIDLNQAKEKPKASWVFTSFGILFSALSFL